MLVEAIAEIAVQTAEETVAGVAAVEVGDGVGVADVMEAEVVADMAVAMAGTEAGAAGIKTGPTDLHGFHG